MSGSQPFPSFYLEHILKATGKIRKAFLTLQKTLISPNISVPCMDKFLTCVWKVGDGKGYFGGKEFNAFSELENVEKRPVKLRHNSK